MRVLQLIASNGFYGAEQVVALLSARLAELDCEITVGLFNASKMPGHQLVRSLEERGIRVWDLPCRTRVDLQAVGRLARFLKEERIDVLHTHGYKANVYGWPAARIAGCTVVATCHNWTNRTPALRRYGSLDKFLLRAFDGVVAVSDTVASTLTRSGYASQKLRIIPNGIDTARYHAAARGPVNGRAPVLGTLSRLSTEKGVDVLIRALPRILERYPTLQCVVAGEGPERAQLLLLAAELGVSDHLQLLGFCTDAPGFLSRCSIVVHPSRVDGMPLALLEAMAAGKPIVASAVGGIPALLRDGIAGVLVPSDDPDALADGVLRLLADTDLGERCALEAAVYAHRYFDAALMGFRYLEAYREVCKVLPSTEHPAARVA